jgi:hypothetical protein
MFHAVYTGTSSSGLAQLGTSASTPDGGGADATGTQEIGSATYCSRCELLVPPPTPHQQDV